jgi:ABC-type antimicrobial peptide transport system permease subunit
MNAWRFILASLRHYRRIHLAVALGVAVATAVLTGALLVGDSVRGSLRDLTLQRLGRIDSAIVAGHMFRAELASEVASDAGFRAHFASALPAILVNGTLQSGSGADVRRATSISVIGVGPEFWSLGEGGPKEPLADDGAALTQAVADELGVAVGDSILLQIPVAGAIPADSPLGAKQLEKTSRSRRFRVAAVLAPLGLARFGLMPSQQLPRNVFVSLGTLQELVDQPGKANAIFVAGEQRADAMTSSLGEAALREALRPRLEDFGLKVEQLETPVKCVQISSDQLVLPDAVVRAAESSLVEGSLPKSSMAGRSLQPVVAYLANTIVAGTPGAERKIPYSIVAGVDSVHGYGPVVNEVGQPIQLAENEIALNRWAADDLKVAVGDDVRITFYEPESTHGQLREHEPVVFKLRAIVELTGIGPRPNAAADPKLTPEMPGVTDQKSIDDWDLPFELVEKIRPEDEKYWDEYSTTPKAFVSLAAAKKLWASRWGTISLLRIVDSVYASDVFMPGELALSVAAGLRQHIDPAALGMSILPVKKLGLAAATGTTPFDGLFLGFSFFLIAAAVMLVAILFQLGIQLRTAELGTLAAVGVGRRRISRLLAREGAMVAAVGAAIGVVAGVLYAWFVIFGLRTWWVAAISTPFIKLHLTPQSLVIGWVVGVVVSWLAIRSSIRRLVRLPAARLLAGTSTMEGGFAQDRVSPPTLKSKIAKFVSWRSIRVGLVLIAAALCVGGFFLKGEAQAGIFFGSGAIVLALLLGEIRFQLRNYRGRNGEKFSLPRLSALNAARNPGRSSLTIGLVAAASFLIVAISAFRLDTGEGGTGGFEFVGTSALPIHYDLNTREGRQELGISDQKRKDEQISDEQILEGWKFYSLRVAAGEDASCLNLYQPTQPRVLGVSDAFIERGGFAWSASADGFDDKPWTALKADLGRDAAGEPVVPAVLDMSTAVYSLHLGGVGSRLTIRDAAGRPATVQIVGLLSNSVLQGNLLVSEANFLRLFPDTGGYSFFLIENVKGSRASSSQELAKVLESTLSVEGFDVVDAREQLAQFLAVQNTYLSTFQSLGALGLLLGTIGLAVVQLRSVLERRGELALMRAGGFQRKRLTWMVVWENAALLVGGLAVGCIAATVALIPQWVGTSVPWGTLALLLVLIAVVGLVAGWATTRRELLAPILPALRGD